MYLYETHLHTSEASLCAQNSGAEYPAHYRALGYQGIIVTDHFFNGNTTIPANLPWEERVRLFCMGYRNAREAGDRMGFQVFFGWESRYHWDEYLVYGLSPEWLAAHPEIVTCDPPAQHRLVRAGGGVVVQAHPFRERGYMSEISLRPYDVDGVEVANAGNDPAQDALAFRYARRFDLPMTAGSDAHMFAHAARGRALGVAFDAPLADIGDYVRVLRERRAIGLNAPAGRFDGFAPEGIRLPVYAFDAEGRAMDTSARTLFG